MSQTHTESTARPRRVRSVDDLQRRTPEPGDAAFRGADVRRAYFVVGEFPNGDFEVVSFKQVSEKTIRVEAYADVLAAIDHGRLVTYRADSGELTPYPGGLDLPDADEVRR